MNCNQQDRRVAVEFLAKYCQQVEMVNLTIRVKKRQLKITKDNAFLKQEIDVSLAGNKTNNQQAKS